MIKKLQSPGTREMQVRKATCSNPNCVHYFNRKGFLQPSNGIFFLLLILISITSYAQVLPDSTVNSEIELGEVVVTSGRTPVSAQKAARIVALKYNREIETAAAADFSELLRSIPGIDPRQRGPFGVQSDIIFRGGTFEQTLILLNGINISDPQTGHHTMNIPVDLGDIERIEILKGPAAKTFGQNAFSGVINIITSGKADNEVKAGISYGGFSTYKTGLSVSGNKGKFSGYLSAGLQSSDGYISNTDHKSGNLYLNGSHEGRLFRTELQAGYLKKDFGANSFYSLKYPSQFEATETTFASTRIEKKGRVKVSAAGFLRHNRDRFELIRNSSSVPFNHHSTITSGLNLNGSARHRYGTINLGYDFRYENIISNVLGLPLNKPVEVKGYDNTFYNKSYSRYINNIFAEYYLSAGRLNVNTGLLISFTSDNREAGLYPGIDAGYRLSERLKLFASVNRTLRMPSFTEMFYTSPVQKGNPLLKPERATTSEAGFKYDLSPVSVTGSFFSRNGRELIDWVKSPSPDSTVWRSLNHARIDVSGAELSVTFIPPRFKDLTKRRSVTFSAEFTDAGRKPDTLLSRYVFDFLDSRFIAAIDFWIAGRLFVAGEITYSDRHGSYQDANGAILEYRPYWITDFKATWKGKSVLLHFGVSNLFDTRWYDFGGLPQPGIWINTGAKVSFRYGRKG